MAALSVVAPDGSDGSIRTPLASPGGEKTADGDDVNDAPEQPLDDDKPVEPLLAVPISWTKGGAKAVSVYTSYDNFSSPTALEPTEQKKKGKTKTIHTGTLQLPVGSHLIQFDVDGEMTFDDKRPVMMARGSEYNSFVVGADGKETKADDTTGDLKIDASAAAAAGADGDEPATPAGGAAGPSKTSGAARRKKKKAAAAAAGAAGGEADGADDGPDEEESPQAKSAPRITAAMATKKVAEELAKKEAEWRDAWLLSEMRSQQTREAEKMAMRNAWTNERTVWLQRIKQFQGEAASDRSKALDLQAQLDAALAKSALGNSDEKRLEERAAQQQKFLQDEVARLKKRISEQDGEKESAGASLAAANTRLEHTVTTLQAAAAHTSSLLDTKGRELEESQKELTSVKDATKAQIAALEKEISKMRQEKLLKSGTSDKKTLNMKKTFNAEMFQVAQQLDKAEKELAAAKLRIGELEAGANQSKATAGAAEAQGAEQEAKLKAANAALSAAQTQAETLQTQLSAAKQDNAQLTVKNTALNAELTDLKANAKSAADGKTAAASEAQAAAADAKRRVAEVEGELKLTRDALQQKLADGERKRAADVAKLTEAEAAAQKALDAAKKEVAALTTERAALDGALKAAKAATEDVQRAQKLAEAEAARKLDEAKDESASAVATAKREAKFKTDELESALARAKLELDATTKTLADTKAARTGLTSELETSKAELTAAKGAVEKHTAKIAELSGALAKHEADRAGLKAKLEASVQELEAKLAALQKSLLDKQTALDKALGDVEREKSGRALEVAAAQREKKDFARQIDELQKSKTGLKTQTIAVHREAKKLHAALGLIREKYAELQKEYAKSIGDARKFLLDSLLAQSKLLAETMKKYKEEMAERRKYFNLVQELRGNIRVFARARPFLKSDEEKNTTNAVGFPQENIITVKRVVNNKDTIAEYEFDRVFIPTNNQVDVFNDTKALVVSCMDGYNVCIFAYGQTGSGKTFTMEGPADDRGVNFRALNELFRIKQVRKDYSYKIFVSMKEVYNEKIRDLLASKDDGEQDYKIRTNEQGTYVEGLTQVEVHTEEDVLALMKRGNSNRSTGRTNMNEHSSRSHSLLSVEVHGVNNVAGVRYFGKLHLIDLAGSERLSKTAATGDRLKEAQAINKSLSCLGNVIQALQKKDKHVPYRDSKLTFLLQDSLGNNAKTLMFINVSPTSYDSEETNNSLIFATRVRKTELGKAEKNEAKADDAPAGAAASAPSTPAAAAKPAAAKPVAAGAAKPAAASTPRASTSTTAAKATTPVKKPVVAPKTPTAAKR